MSILIASTHVHSKHSDNWIKLQAQFIAKTIGDFEYGVIVNGDDPSNYTNVLSHFTELKSHLYCINIILDLFAKSDHTTLLLLDNDCWPIRNNWIDILNKLMGTSFSYAAPARIENFDMFPHPSAFYVQKRFLDRLDFGHCRISNMLNISVSDVGSKILQIVDGEQQWYPLLKSNYVNPHPVYASIYGDLFYHHCAGSRGIGFRAARFGYYDHVIRKKEHNKIYEKVTQNLIADPIKFINYLRGIGIERGGYE